ncbi:hypothetical protein GOP47_0030884 [Adiantum capillus-veneris]|nr:hypothetical protein GOP47_0030884 [Adiantum capillus-veneris]
MRKRLRDEINLKDNLGGAGKQRRKLKMSEKLAQELEFFEKTLNDAQSCYEELKARKLRPESNCCTGFVNFQPLPPIPVDLTSSPKQNHLPIPMLPDAIGSPLSSPIEHVPIPIEHAPIPIEHVPIPEYKSGIIMDDVGNLAVKGGFEMQYKPSPQLPCPGVALAQASQVFASFLQRLTQHGVVLQFPTTPAFVKEKLRGGRNEVTPEMGPMRSKEAASADLSSLKLSREVVAEGPKELEQEKPSFAKFTRDEVVFVEATELGLENSSSLGLHHVQVAEESSELGLRQEKVADESNKVEPENAPPLNFSRDIEELKEVEADKRQWEEFLVPGRGEKAVSESDIEDDDGLKNLWDAMELSLACTNETKNSRVEADNSHNDGCTHDFYKRDDMGLVCSKCGLIGQDAEYIFNYVWGEVIGLHVL